MSFKIHDSRSSPTSLTVGSPVLLTLYSNELISQLLNLLQRHGLETYQVDCNTTSSPSFSRSYDLVEHTSESRLLFCCCAVVRACVPRMILDDVFEQKNDIAKAVSEELEKVRLSISLSPVIHDANRFQGCNNIC